MFLCSLTIKHTRLVFAERTPGFACRAFSDTSLLCFMVKEHTNKCSCYIVVYKCIYIDIFVLGLETCTDREDSIYMSPSTGNKANANYEQICFMRQLWVSNPGPLSLRRRFTTHIVNIDLNRASNGAMLIASGHCQAISDRLHHVYGYFKDSKKNLDTIKLYIDWKLPNYIEKMYGSLPPSDGGGIQDIVLQNSRFIITKK